MSKVKDGISLVKVAGMVVIMVEVFPTVSMLALTEEQAARLGTRLVEYAVKENDAEGSEELQALDMLRKAKGEPS